MMYEEKFMIMALELAKQAADIQEVPVGAVLVDNDVVIGHGYNQVVAKNSVTAHAEIIAINNASRKLNNYRLIDCQIYTTLEPCHMCAKAILDARLNHLYFGALEPKTGAIKSIDHFFDRKDLNHKVSYSGGHREAESSRLLKEFFKNKRKKSFQ